MSDITRLLQLGFVGSAGILSSAAISGVLGAKAALGAKATATIPGKIPKVASGVKGGAAAFKNNAKTELLTTTWLQRLFTTRRTVTTVGPSGVAVAKQITSTPSNRAALIGVGTIGVVALAFGVKDIIGTYPFAGFIKEETLQTLDFAVTAAERNNDVEGAEKAAAFTREVLDETVWEFILSGIPYINIQAQNRDNYKAALIKLEINEKRIEDLKLKLETGMTDAEIFTARTLAINEAAEERVDYFNEQRIISEKEILRLRKEARQESRQERKEDLEFQISSWEEFQARQRELEEAERIRIRDFWIEFFKEKLRLQEANRPSQLNFGGLF